MYDTQNLIIQNRLLTEEVKRRVDQMAAINTVAATVSQSLDLDVTLNTALRAVVEVVGAEAGGISLIDQETRDVVLRAQLGWTHDHVVTQPMRVPAGKGMSGQVISENDVLVYNNLDGTEQYAVPGFDQESFKAIAMAPMHARGRIIGILSIMSNKPNSFNEDIVNVLRAIADTVGVALDNAMLYEETVEQNSRLNAILYSTADGIIATEQNGRINLINQAAETMLNVRAADLIGAPLREAAIPPQARELLLKALANRAEGKDKAFQVTLENGRTLHVLASPVQVDSQVDQEAEADGWVIVLQDVTHIRQAELARAEFIQAAAHDMRNPLSVTFNSLDMLRDLIHDSGGDETAKEVIDIALTGVQRLRSLIDDLLHLEQIESGFGFNQAEVDVRELLREVSADVRPLMIHKSLAFTITNPDDLPPVRLDRRWIARAILNYLENAAKYTQEGGSVALSAFIKEDHLHIEVSDDGPGIPIKAQSRLFERFYRVDESKKIPGTGLGLAIVKSVAEAHGGSVYIHSREREGSTFGIKLPLITVAPTA